MTSSLARQYTTDMLDAIEQDRARDGCLTDEQIEWLIQEVKLLNRLLDHVLDYQP